MSLHFLTGKMSGGKSFNATRMLVQELRISERKIVTNLPLLLEDRKGRRGLIRYVHEEIEKPVDLRKRLLVLNKEQVREFWLYEPGFPVIEARAPLFRGGPLVPDFSERCERLARGEPGILYIIDEAHLYFDARAWQQLGADCQFFMSQHSKMACDVICVTQHCEKVDKNFRRDAQDFTEVRNLGKERFWLGVRLKNKFRRLTFLTEPNKGNAVAVESHWLSFDKTGIESLYDTTAGVGIMGRLDDRREAKGGHWIRWVFALAAICFTLIFGVYFLLKGVRHFASKAVGMAVPKHVVKKASDTNTLMGVVLPTVGPAVVEAKKADKLTVGTNTLYVTGIMRIGSGGIVLLSDGDSVEVSSGRVEMFGPRGAVVDGVFIPSIPKSLAAQRLAASPPAPPPPPVEMPPVIEYEKPVSTLYLFGKRPPEEQSLPEMRYGSGMRR